MLLHHTMPVVVLSNLNPDSAIPYAGMLRDFPTDDGESAAEAAVRELRVRGVSVNQGDVLFFPRASPGHRRYVVPGGPPQ